MSAADKTAPRWNKRKKAGGPPINSYAYMIGLTSGRSWKKLSVELTNASLSLCRIRHANEQTPDVALGVASSAPLLRRNYLIPGVATCASAQGRGNSHETTDDAQGRRALPDIFHKEWHDWIVKRDGQLATFRRYIRENPERAALRRNNAPFFGAVRRVSFLGREWLAYGNLEILKLPALLPIKGHRTTLQDSSEWNALVAAASRIGPGGAGVSTFMSPLEKACGNAITQAGGRWLVLSPEGFGPRWHPPREKERFCAQGRMLFLSLYEADTKKPTRKMLYDRCHEMIDLVCEKPGDATHYE